MTFARRPPLAVQIQLLLFPKPNSKNQSFLIYQQRSSRYAFSGDKDIDPLFEDLWNLFARGDCWKLAEGAMDTLKTLQERGYELAVLSNNDSRLRTVLADLQIEQVFHHIFISSEMGIEKPDPKIFRQVETVTGKKPAEILHLGDSHSRDFLGARNAGWSALLYGEPKLEDEQITHFSELLERLS